MSVIGKKIIHLESVDSTNNYIAKLIYEGNIENGSVILTDEQTAGRGQRGNLWTSKPGENLTTSIYYTPANLSVNQQFYLTIITALAVCNCLNKMGVPAQIKWPNDILIENKKIAGILIENTLSGTSISHSIIGIGLNVNQTQFEHDLSTSIKQEKNQFFPIQSILFSLISELNDLLALLNNHQYETLIELYYNNLWLLNKTSSFTDSDGKFNGKIIGIDEIGRLIIEKGKGETKVYDLKEIKFNARNAL